MTNNSVVACFILLVIILIFGIVGYKIDKELDAIIKFKNFIVNYNRTYDAGSNEYLYRLRNFQDSLQRHEKLNSARLNDYDAWYGINQFSDFTLQEFQDAVLTHIYDQKTSHLKTANGHGHHGPKNVYEFTSYHGVDLTNIPQQLDWRKKGVIGDVRSQGTCGACWAFSVVETLASVKAIRYKDKPTVLSAQQLVDCAQDNHGCSGGDTCKALHWLKQNNIPVVPEKEYPYEKKTQTCKMKHPATGTLVKSYTCETLVGKEDTMVSNIHELGPLAVAVDATTWRDYMGGIIQYHCYTSVNHAVQIVGYNLSEPVPYYIVRNQWGAQWGIHGYLRIKIGKNLCGIASEVVSIAV